MFCKANRMRPLILVFAFLFFCRLPLPAQSVMVITIDGSINPVVTGFIHRSLEQAHRNGAECLIIHLNTPGGLLKSTRYIVSDLLEAPVPVVVYVSPGGAQAGSAGVFLALAAHIAAMAPGTNIGAAHPVSMQGQRDTIMDAKATNDAAAFIRSIAEKRKRNVAWAEEAVRTSTSITETEALQKQVIDLVVPNTAELLKRIDGRKVIVRSGTKTLHTRNARLETFEMSWSEQILDKISDPNLAYVLLLLGFYGILFELYNPGAILPGIVGGICLILALYTMHTLPVNYAGLALLIFAIILFLLEIKIVSYGALAIGGVISLLLGAMMLFRPDSSLEVVRLSWSVILSSVGVTAFFFLFVIGLGLKAQRLRPVTGIEGMVGDIGESLDALNPGGTVWVHGEIWQAESVRGPVSKGQKVRVVGITNLKLQVEGLNYEL
jgi:membrane-bound serine protease (ClpP class)